MAVPPPDKASSPGSLLDRLVAKKYLSKAKLGDVLRHARYRGVSAAEAVLQLGLMNETDLLRFVASTHGTQFVSTAKLSKLKVDENALRMVPVALAERLMVFPILYGSATKLLSIVTADPGSERIFNDIQQASPVGQVKAFAARESAVRAAILKYYYKERNAFDALLLESARQASAVPNVARAPSTAPSMRSKSPSVAAPASERAAPKTPSSVAPIPIDLSAVSIPVADPVAVHSQSGIPMEPAQAPSVKPLESVAPQGLEIGAAAYLDTLKVLVALIEQHEGARSGHCFQVAQLCRRLAGLIGMPLDQIHAVEAAAYLHDIGKMSGQHVTPLVAVQSVQAEERAKKTCGSPTRFFDRAELPGSIVEILEAAFERYDGSGFPKRLSGKNIPLGARILAVAESYVDLVHSEANVFGRRYVPGDACTELSKHQGKVFDSLVVDWLRTCVLGEDMEQRLLSSRHTVLVVDPDPEETALLEVKLPAHGFEVGVARNIVTALEELRGHRFDLVIAEVDLPDGEGFELVNKIREEGWQMPVMFVTSREDDESVNRGFELGAADYLRKPAAVQVVGAKAKRIVEQQGADKKRGVSGSLSEMSLPDVVQILANGRKTGHLHVRGVGRKGELVFSEGMIFDASCDDLKGDEAVYALLGLTQGEFELTPTPVKIENQINMSAEGLLLEGMRRLDEAGRT